MTNRKQKRVLITGCSSGFGLRIAVDAAKQGYDCIATMRNLNKADGLKNALAHANVTATIDQLDVTSPQQIAEIAEKYAPIDILVNNAGILITGSFIDRSPEESRLIFDTNYFGAQALTQAVAKQMIAQKSGLIINIASLAGHIGHMFNADYSASKHALMGFTKSIRVELKPFGVKVVSVEPGYHRTEIIRANANLCENFYDKTSPMFDYNRGFLRLMFKKIVPNAGNPKAVTHKVLEIMSAKKSKPHYIIGREAKLAVFAKRIGLENWLEGEFYKKLREATRREIRKERAKQAKRDARKKNKQAEL